jgi:hypothetical protein
MKQMKKLIKSYFLYLINPTCGVRVLALIMYGIDDDCC